MTMTAASSWEAEIESWATKLRAGGRRPQTIGLRRAHLRMLSRWSAPRGPWELGTEDLEAWTGSMNWGPETRRSVRSTLRGFYTWGVTAKRIEVNPATDLAAIKALDPMPRPCDVKVLKAAVQAAPPREVLMMRLAAEVGLRRGEIAQVHTSDVMPLLLGYGLLVHGKGGKKRMVGLPVDGTLGLELARTARQEPGYLFPGKIDGHLSASWVGRIVSRWLDGPWTMHTLRHFFATTTFAKSKNLLAVQRQLGHASPATTQRYIATPLDDLQGLADIAAEALSA
jgi:site-specific recombinase XerC